jgi:Zn-dependent protease with chaperone function
VSIVVQSSCARCSAPLIALPENTPWCGACEWNLDNFPEVEGASWFWRRIVGLDRRAGFRAHRRQAASTGRNPGVYLFLIAVSVLIVLADMAVAGAGLWLVIDGFSLVKLLGIGLLGLAYLFRPRLFRVKDLMGDYTYAIEREQTPELYRLVERVAAETGAPMPDRIHLDFRANASAGVVGLRRTSVLTLGVPLLLALRPQEQVALIGHELGHLKHLDSTRSLLTRPARSFFGRLSRLIRPKISVLVVSGPFGIFYLAAQFAGGLLSLLFAAVHTWFAVLAADDDRNVELRADAMAANAAGTQAALTMLDVFAASEPIIGHIEPYVPAGEAAATWRRLVHAVRERETPALPAYRQLSIRTAASLLASHPPAGRRHQWLTARPYETARVVVDTATAGRLEREIDPYAEAMHRAMNEHPARWVG